jgi:hypothetical protein
MRDGVDIGKGVGMMGAKNAGRFRELHAARLTLFLQEILILTPSQIIKLDTHLGVLLESVGTISSSNKF